MSQTLLNWLDENAWCTIFAMKTQKQSSSYKYCDNNDY